MSDHVLLLAPSANRVYAGLADRLIAAELAVLLRGAGSPAIAPLALAGVPYLSLAVEELGPDQLTALGRLSGLLALFRRDGALLSPLAVPRPDLFDDDLVTIPKYPGKTNEQFTRLLLNVTLASVDRALPGPAAILDPMCGRGTTLSTGLTLGHDVAGVESDVKAVEAYAAYLRTYLRRRRLKHKVELTPVRREGRTLGRRLDVSVTPADSVPTRELTVFSGDTRSSAALYGKRRFDAIVLDAPYGVVHGSAAAPTDVRGAVDTSAGGKRERSPAGLIAEAMPTWAAQLRAGGALGLSWNTYGLSRERLAELAAEAGLRPLDDGPYRDFAHRVDSSIQRDVFIAVKPQ